MDPKVPILRDRARQLRRNQTDVEKKLWSRLRARQIGGAKFRRQYPIGHFIVDFCCFEGRLVVELDGGQHAEAGALDQRRTEFLVAEGYRVLRFWNNEATENIDGGKREFRRPSPFPLPEETVSQFTRSPSTSSGRTGKYLNFRLGNTVRDEALEP
ncbi:MAG TPA: endonuclease domain-containing protein [Candidatus Binatia bacterium]